jgi:O-acetyl-ADP-ribose deacetylase (regulator of RNase III)
LLASCYRSSLAIAAKPEFGIRTVAFPSISTGAYGYPLDRAAPLAMRTIAEALAEHPAIERVTMVCFGQESYRAYSDALAALTDDRG